MNNKRTACRVAATLGDALGGALGVIDVGPASGRGDALRQWLAGTALPAALAMPGIVGAHLGEADAAATTVKTDEKKLLQTPDAMARWLVLLEGVDHDMLARATQQVLSDSTLHDAGAEGEIDRRDYQLGFVMSRRA